MQDVSDGELVNRFLSLDIFPAHRSFAQDAKRMRPRVESANALAVAFVARSQSRDCEWLNFELCSWLQEKAQAHYDR